MPYYLGERSVRRFALNALPVILIAILIGGALSTNLLLSQADAVPLASTPGPFMSPTMALANGTVIPYRADPTQPFTFRVKLKTQANATPTDFAVFMNLTTISGLASYATSDFPMTFSPGANSSTNTHNGTWYELTNLNLSNQIYGYGFSVWDKETNWTLTNQVLPVPKKTVPPPSASQRRFSSRARSVLSAPSVARSMPPASALG